MSARWISAFLEAQAAERGAATNTQLGYGRDLGLFAEWLTARGRSLETASRDDIQSWLIEAEAAGLARATRARRLASVRQLYRFAHEEGWRDDDPARTIPGVLRPGPVERVPPTSCPISRTDPDCQPTCEDTARSSVVLPCPFRPTSPIRSPSATESEMSCSTRSGP